MEGLSKDDVGKMKLVRLGDFMENMVACSIVCHGISFILYPVRIKWGNRPYHFQVYA